MKKKLTFLSLAILIILGITFSSVFAASPAGITIKKTGMPAARAPEKAADNSEKQKEVQEKDNNKNKEKEKEKAKEKEKSRIPPGLAKPLKSEKSKIPPAAQLAHKTIHLRGVIESVSEDSLDLKTSTETYSIIISADTAIHIPQEGNDAAPSGLIKGAQASVKAIEDPQDTYTAVQIHVIPAKPAQVHHVGTVSTDNRAVDGTLAITWKDGTTSIVQVGSSTVFLPKDADSSDLSGKLVTVIAPRYMSGEEIPAKEIVIHPDQKK